MFDAVLGDFLESFTDGMLQGGGDLDIEAASNEREAEGFAGLFGELDADAAEDAFAGFEDDAAGLADLGEAAALAAVTAVVDAVGGGVVLEGAIAGGAAIAMEAAAGFLGGFFAGEAGAAVAGGSDAVAGVGSVEEEVEFAFIEAAHDAGEGFVGPLDGVAGKELVDAMGGGLAFAHGADDLGEAFDGAAGGEDARDVGEERVGLAGDAGGAGAEAEGLDFVGMDFAGGDEDGLEAAGESVEGEVFAEFDAEDIFGAETFEGFEFEGEGFGREIFGIDFGAEGAAGLFMAVDDGAGVSFAEEVIGGGEAGGAGADNDDGFAGGRFG